MGGARGGAPLSSALTPPPSSQACVETAQRTGAGPTNFPLRIDVAEGGVKQQPSDFSAELMLRLLPKLDWSALRQTARELGIADLPVAPPPDPASDEAFLKSLHDLIMDVHIVEGALVCPNCARRYAIKQGIPNMLLSETELVV